MKQAEGAFGDDRWHKPEIKAATHLDVSIDGKACRRLDVGLHSGVFGASCASISLQALFQVVADLLKQTSS